MSKTASLLLSLALGGVLGFALSRALPSSNDDLRALDPARVNARAREILSSPEPLQRIAELSALLRGLDRDDVPAVTEAFEDAPLDGGDPELIVLATWWAAFDPKAAFAWTTSDWRAGYGAVIASLFRAWAHVDPQEALENAAKLRYPGQLDMAKEAIYAGWDESGKPGLMEVFNQLRLGDQQRLAQILARRRVIVLGTQGAIEWLKTFPNPEVQEMMALRVASAAAGSKQGAREISEWATPLIAAAKEPTGFPRRIGTRWVQHDPLAAMAWLSSLPPGVDRDDGVAEAFRDWLMKDFSAADAWIHEKIQPDDIERWVEPAVSIFVKTNGMARPQESLELAARLEDQDLRDSASVILLIHWMKRDRAAAEAWLAKSNLSAEVRKRVEVGYANAIARRPGPDQQVGLPHGPLGPPER
jgi:hypothetical protein